MTVRARSGTRFKLGVGWESVKVGNREQSPVPHSRPEKGLRTNRLPTDSQPSRRTGPKLSGRMRVQSIRPSLIPRGKLGKIRLGLEGRVAEGDQAQWVPQKQRSRYETLSHGEPATR